MAIYPANVIWKKKLSGLSLEVTVHHGRGWGEGREQSWGQLCSWRPEVTVWLLREFTMEPEDITFKARSQQSMSLRQATVHRTHNLSEQQHVLGPAFKHMSLWVRWFLFKLLHILWCSVPVKTAHFCYVNGEKITEPSIQEFDVCMVLTLLNDTRSGAELTSPSFMKLRSVL